MVSGEKPGAGRRGAYELSPARAHARSALDIVGERGWTLDEQHRQREYNAARTAECININSGTEGVSRNGGQSQVSLHRSFLILSGEISRNLEFRENILLSRYFLSFTPVFISFLSIVLPFTVSPGAVDSRGCCRGSVRFQSTIIFLAECQRRGENTLTLLYVKND